MRDLTDQRTDALERLAVRARQGFILYGVVLCAVGLADLARRSFDAGEVHGLRTAIVFIVGGVLIHALRRHDRTRRIAIDCGVLLTAAIAMNYARLATKGFGGTEPDTPRLLVLGSLALAGALILLRILPARLDLARHRRRGTIRRGLTGVLGAGLIGLGVFLSTGVRGPQQSIAALIELAPLAGHLEGALEEILSDPRGLEHVLASDEIRNLAVRFAEDERFARHADLRRLAQGIADGDTASLRELVPPEVMAAAHKIMRTARKTPEAPDAAKGPRSATAGKPKSIVPLNDDAAATTELRRRLQEIAGALSPEQLARLRAMDPGDPRIRDALVARHIDPELAARLLAEQGAGARHGVGPPPASRSAATPARSGPAAVAGPPSKVRTKLPAHRIQHIVRLPRATADAPPPIATGIRHRPAVRTTPEDDNATEPMDVVADAGSDVAPEVPSDAVATSPPPPLTSAPPAAAAAPIGPAFDEVLSLLRAAAPPPPTSPAPRASRPERYGGAALLILGLIAVGLSLRKTQPR